MELIYTENAPEPVGPYSQAVKAAGFLYCSGQIPITPKTQVVHSDESISFQTRLCLENLKQVIQAGGSDLSKVIKVNIFLSSMDHFVEMNQVYTEFFEDFQPARACVAVLGLPKKVDVEIEAVALANG